MNVGKHFQAEWKVHRKSESKIRESGNEKNKNA